MPTIRIQWGAPIVLVWLLFATGAGVLYAQPALRAAPRTEMDIPYVEGGGHKQQLDLYLPDGTGFPTVLFVHGGSLFEGDRKEAPYPLIGQAFQQAGAGCAVMSYRTGAGVLWPAQPGDVAAAYAWLRGRIAARGGDPGRLFLVGHSSGGLLVATVAADSTYLKTWGLAPRDIAGCVPMGTLLTMEPAERTWAADRLQTLFKTNAYMKLFGTPEVFNAAHNPIRRVGRHAPPFLILVAEGERKQPPILASAEAFVAATVAAGGRAAFEVLPARNHQSTITNMTTPDDPTVRRIMQFFTGR